MTEAVKGFALTPRMALEDVAWAAQRAADAFMSGDKTALGMEMGKMRYALQKAQLAHEDKIDEAKAKQ